jgi:plastocyanin
MKLLLVPVLLSIVLIGGCVQNGPVNTTTGNTVAIQSFAFSPASLTVKAGDTVVWTNMDSAQHTVTSDSGSELNSALLANGQTYSHTFTTAGTYPYHCTVHASMHGTITVV